MFEVEFRPQRRSDARSERCSKLVLLWFTIIAIICIVFFFLSHILASVITVIVLLSMMWFTWYYFHSAPPETEPTEVHRATMEVLSPSDIAEIPSFSFQRNIGDDFKDFNGSNGGVGWLQCAVCIATVKEGEMVRRLPVCKHVFHLMCIDTWLGSHSTCPMCRADVKTGEVSSEPPVPPV